MLKKIIAPLLMGTVMLFTLVPSETFAQTPVQPKATEGEHTLSEAQVKPKPDLKAVFAKEIMTVKARNLTAADYKRIEKRRQQQQASQQSAKMGLTKREKIGLIVFIVAMVAITTALLIHGIDDSPNCFEDPFDPSCN